MRKITKYGYLNDHSDLIALMAHPEILENEDVALGSPRDIEWICTHCGNVYIKSIYDVCVLGRRHSCSAIMNRHAVAGFNDLLTLYPDLVNTYWDWERNNKVGLHPNELLPLSNKKIYIHCPTCGPVDAPVKIKSVMNKTGCPYCRKGRKVFKSGINDLLTHCTKHPELNRNGKSPADLIILPEGMSASDIPYYSTTKYDFECEFGEMHITTAAMSDRTRNDGKSTGCHFCSKGTAYATASKNAVTWCKENGKAYLINEYSANNTKRLSEYTPYSKQKVLWTCPVCMTEKPYSVSQVLHDDTCHCPRTQSGTSIGQEVLTSIIKDYFGEWLSIESRSKKYGLEIDILMSNGEREIGIEYGSAFTHTVEGVIAKRKEHIDAGLDEEIVVFELKKRDRIKADAENKIYTYTRRNSRDFDGLKDVVVSVSKSVNEFFSLKVNISVITASMIDTYKSRVLNKSRWKSVNSVADYSQKYGSRAYFHQENNTIDLSCVSLSSNSVELVAVCPTCGNRWNTVPNSIRKSKGGCNCCSPNGDGTWIGHNDFESVTKKSGSPNRLWFLTHWSELDCEGNPQMPPSRFRANSTKPCWFKCDNGHLFSKKLCHINARSRGCEECYIKKYR